MKDWKKFAAQTLSDNDVEKAFLDQAYMLIQNKATPLMRPPHRLGFEIVYKNDANTKMVGIFVFRIGRELYYAPVFFLNGNIKGTDLFYRHSTKTFVPLTNEWVDYLLHLSQAPEGESVDKSVRQEAHNSMDLTPLIQPPLMHKMASEAFGEMCQKAETMTKQAAKETGEAASLLRRFIIEDGRHDAIRKIASAAQNFEFANALFMASSPDDFAPELTEEKSAAEESTTLLAIHFDPLFNDSIKSANAQDIAKGYIIEDNRKEAAINPIVYEPLEQSLEGIADPGIYEVLMSDGSRKRLLVAKTNPDSLFSLCGDEHTSCPQPVGDYYPHSNSRAPQLTVVNPEDKNSRTTPYSKEIYGEFVSDLKDSDLLKDEPESGKAYRLLNLDRMTLTEAVLVKATGKSDSGLKTVDLSTYYEDANPRTFTLNPDYDGQLDGDRVLGKNYKFVEVAFEHKAEGQYTGARTIFSDRIPLGDKAAMDGFIYGNGYKKASVIRLNQDYLSVRLHETGPLSPGLTKLAAKLALMNECSLREGQVDEILGTVEERSSFSFLYHPMEKKAMNLQWPAFPEFYEDFSGDFGVPYEDQNSMHSQVVSQKDPTIPLFHRVGDAVHHEGRNENEQDNNADNQQELSPEQMDTASPMSLYQLSQQKGLGNLFEHGVVGSLVKTYDSVALVEKYLPDLEQALDRVGRILFLLYWKPEDFSEAYGSDDQTELENQLLSNFKSWGDMVLDFLLKSEKTQKGNTAF